MDIVLSANSKEPIYEQLYNQISAQIVNNSICAGTKLPTIRQVAAELHISVIPVKRAWEELDRNKLITTIAGKGTFVSDISKKELLELKEEKAAALVKNFCSKTKEMELSLEQVLVLITENY